VGPEGWNLKAGTRRPDQEGVNQKVSTGSVGKTPEVAKKSHLLSSISFFISSLRSAIVCSVVGSGFIAVKYCQT
jgi:hypothetical protein